MKKILVTLLVVSSMVFALATAAMASNVYLDGMVGGTFDFGSEYDLSGITIGTNINCDKFMFNLEYGQDNIDLGSGSDSDFDLLNLKGSYLLSGDAENYVALTVGYHQMKWDDYADMKIDGLLIGADLSGTIDKSRLEGSIGYSISGTAKYDSGDQDVDTLKLSAKYSYYFTDNFGLGVGYKYTQYKFENGIKWTSSGPTVGVTYQFK